MVVLYSAKDQCWKITDFGLTSEGTSNRLVTTRYARGKPCYRAPELLSNEKGGYSNKLDMWSLGCILFELVTGAKAFASDYAVFEYRLNPESRLQAGPHPSLLRLHHIYLLLQSDPLSRPSASHAILLNELTVFLFSQDELVSGFHQKWLEDSINTVVESSMELAVTLERHDIITRVLENPYIVWSSEMRLRLVSFAIKQRRSRLLPIFVNAGWDGAMCLSVVAKENFAEAVAVLVEAGVPVDAPYNGRTALETAIASKSEQAMMSLLETGSDVALVTDLVWPSSFPRSMSAMRLLEQMREMSWDNNHRGRSWRIRCKKERSSIAPRLNVSTNSAAAPRHYFLWSHPGFWRDFQFSLLTEGILGVRGELSGNHCIRFSADGKYLAFCRRGVVDIFTSSGSKKRMRIDPGVLRATVVCFIPNSNNIVICGTSPRIKLCDITSGEPRRSFIVPVGGIQFKIVMCLDVSRDGRQLASGCDDGSVRLWNIDTGALSHTILVLNPELRCHILSLTFSEDGSSIAASGSNKFIYIFKVCSSPSVLINWIRCPSIASSFAFLPAESGIFCHSDNGSMSVLNLKPGKRKSNFHLADELTLSEVGSRGGVTADGSWIVCASPGSSVMRFYDTGDKRLKFVFFPMDFNEPVENIWMGFATERIAVVTRDGAFNIWGTIRTLVKLTEKNTRIQR